MVATRRGGRWLPPLLLLASSALLAVVLARVLVPREAFVARVAAEVKRQTGAEFVPGAATVSLAGGPGLVLAGGSLRGTGAELSRRTGVPNDLGAFTVRYDRLELRLGLGALLRRTLAVRSLRLVADEAEVEFGSDRILAGDLELWLTDLHLTSPSSGDAAVSGAGPMLLAGKLELRIASLDHGPAPWRNVVLAGVWRGRASDDGRLTASLGPGRLDADLQLTVDGAPGGRLSGEVRLEEVPAGLLFGPYLPDLAGRLDCGLDARVTGGLDLRDAATRLATLDLTGRVTAEEGVLEARDWLREVLPYLGSRQDLASIRFARLTHEMKVADGRYHLERFELDGPDTDWQARGWLGFAGDLDVAVAVRLPVGFTPDLGAMSFLAETLRDEAGRVRLGLRVSGRTAAPRLGLDLSQLH